MTDKRHIYTAEFKREAVRLVTEQGYGVAEAARNLGLNASMLGRWKREVEQTMNGAFPGNGWGSLDPEEVSR
jgi:transposase